MGRVKKFRNKRPLILIGCEGNSETEKKYFSNFASINLPIKFASGNSTDPEGILNDIKNYMVKEDISATYNDKIYMVLDTDLNPKRIEQIEKITLECEKLGINIITSAPTFEIWFLLHFRNTKLNFPNSKSVKKELKKYIPRYKEGMNIYNQIVDKTEIAIENAKILEKREKLNSKNKYALAPHTYVYKIIEEIKNNN